MELILCLIFKIQLGGKTFSFSSESLGAERSYKTTYNWNLRCIVLTLGNGGKEEASPNFILLEIEEMKYGKI